MVLIKILKNIYISNFFRVGRSLLVFCLTQSIVNGKLNYEHKKESK